MLHSPFTGKTNPYALLRSAVRKVIFMAIISHFLAASETNKTLNTKEVEAFVKDLLHEQMVKVPAAILVGEARNIASFQIGYAEFEAHVNTYIVPNDPGAMLRHLEEQSFPSNLLWYIGDDEQALLDMLKQLPLGEQDCCICFAGVHEQLAQVYWEGAVVYLLTHPFPMEFCDPIGTNLVPLADRPLAHYFILSSSTGAKMDQETNPLVPVLKRYFGSHLLTRETF